MNDSILQYSINAQQLIRFICEQPTTDHDKTIRALRAISRLSEITIDSIKTHKNTLAPTQHSESNSKNAEA